MNQELEFARRLEVSTIPAGSLHILCLAPLKSRLGTRWGRLSALVHKLFDRAISRVQRPADHFVVLDEFSYGLTFGNLTPPQIRIICATIAREVCENIFGDQIDEISIRSLVAEIVSPSSADGYHPGAGIDTLLEPSDVDTATTPSIQSGSPKHVALVAEIRQESALSSRDQIQFAHSQFAKFRLKLGFFPVWELRRGLSSTLILAPFRRGANSTTASGRAALGGASETDIIDIELTQLSMAAAYAVRASSENKICAIGVGVSYDSLCCFRSRIRYFTALQRLAFSPGNPLLIKLEQIPEGAPEGRIAELIAMLCSQNTRVILEFRSLAMLPQFDIRLGVAAIGGSIPPSLDIASSAAIAEKLISRAAVQKTSTFIDHLDTTERVALARRSNIRFGQGVALDAGYFSGLAKIPDFPLAIARC